MSVRKIERENRKAKYGVKWTVGGNRRFQFFEKKSDRNDFFNEMEMKEKRQGSAALDISTVEAQIMRRCVELLGSPEQVLLAVEARAERTALKSISILEAVRLFLEEKYNLGRDDNWMRANRKILHRFRDYTGTGDIADCTTEQAQAWIFSMPQFKPVTLKNHVKACGSFFNWCNDRNFCRENPFVKVKSPDVIPPEPEFLTVEQTRTLFRTAVQHYPDAIAYLAMRAFAGIRSSACARIAPEEINFAEKGIKITAQNAKNNTRAYVQGHPDNLWSWLEFARKKAPEGFALPERLHRRRCDQIAEKAEFYPPHNALRHSFATYHVALFGDAGRTATLLTHRSDAFMLYKHYKGNTTKAEAEKYFSILPENILEPEI